MSPDKTGVKIREKVYTNHEISSLLPRNAWKLFDAFADVFAIPHEVFLQEEWFGLFSSLLRL